MGKKSRRKKQGIGESVVKTTYKAGKISAKLLSGLVMFLLSLPILGQFLCVLMLVATVFMGASGLVTILQPPKQEDSVQQKLLDWNHKCTCTHLSEEDIAIVKAGGSVNAGNNNGSLNVPSGGIGGTVDVTRGLSGYMWADYPMELFFLSTTMELGITDEAMRECIGDGGRAYGIMQLDFRYALVPFMDYAYNKNPVLWAGLANYTNATPGSSSLVNNADILATFRNALSTNRLEYIQTQCDYFNENYREYFYTTGNTDGFNWDSRHIAVQASLLSASVNLDGRIAYKAFKREGAVPTMTDEQLLEVLYKMWPKEKNLGSRTKDKSQPSEWALALEMLNGTKIPSQHDVGLPYTAFCGGWSHTAALSLCTSSTAGGTNNAPTTGGTTAGGTNNAPTTGGTAGGTNNAPTTGTAGGTNNAPTTGTTGGVIYTEGQKISLDDTWEYANFSAINSGKTTYYLATGTRKNICITVNAGHGTRGVGATKTQSHPDGTGKYTSGTTAAGEITSPAISSGTTFSDGTSEASVNLQVALKLKTKLLANGYDVLMIRESEDEQLDNIARTVISNNVSDAHIAIHFDYTTTNKGVFYMAVVNNAAYKAMEPVKSHWQEHDALGDSLVSGLRSNGATVFGDGTMESDLTQTSYSTIPSVDIELGDKVTPHADTDIDKFAEGLSKGVDLFFQTHTPVNQARRAGQNIGSSSGGGSGSTGTGGNTGTNGGIVNKNLDNLRTSCQMKSEGICGCYISDPGCSCHIFAGEDGIAGTEDDGKDTTEGTTGGSTLGGTAGEVEKACNYLSQEVIKSMNSQYPGRINQDCYASYSHPNGMYGMTMSLTSLNGVTKSFSGRQGVTDPVRPDCSGYVHALMFILSGEDFGITNAATLALGHGGKIKQSDAFILLPFSKDEVQAGDIVAISGHTEVFMGWTDDSKTSAHIMSWGSQFGIRKHVIDTNTGETNVLNAPQTWTGLYNNRNYKSIIRYVRTGGSGK